MLRIFGLIPWAALFLGVVMIIGGVSTMAGDVETEATSVNIAVLENDVDPRARWLEISDGLLYWPEMIEVTSRLTTQRLIDENVEGGIAIDRSYYVPVGSTERIGEWLRQLNGDRSTPGCRMLVHLSKDRLERYFPDVIGAELPVPTPAKIRGTAKPVRELDSDVQSELASVFPGLDREHTFVVDHGIKPLQKDQAATLSVVGMVFAVPSLLWIQWRRNRRRARRDAASRREQDRLAQAHSQHAHDRDHIGSGV